MLRMALAFLIIAVIASMFGFGVIEGFSAQAAQIVFFIFLVLAVLSLLGGYRQGVPPI